MYSGIMRHFMNDRESESMPYIQIKCGLKSKNNGRVDLFFGGMFFAEKKFGLYGTEGIFLLTL